MKPFLKWAGNKYRLIEKIRALLPPADRLIEPFAGAAAVFLNTDYQDNVINDSNPDLIHVFVTLKQYGPTFIDECKGLFGNEFNNADAYYALREEFNSSVDPFRKAALFLYLNRHGYNGLCRYNKIGGFNVPFGRYKKTYFPYEEMMMFYHKSQTAEFSSIDFEVVMRGARPGDVIYCDPPYVPLSATANFTGYNSDGFSQSEQVRLARVAAETAARGVPVVISNHDNEFTRKVYQGAVVTSFDVQRFISCDGDHRGKAKELLALFPGA
ncbi:Dam family site-specific DNA-(adenine-N6)-methyltransferase [Alicyclobacillus sp. ALC3]|uniref:Dam family site-specific DNA-(adenine-N6)-methyltransferase n=1 Tax=Alicyclobacillus sp. ALC3 TaxID=2796143 RepID=UPI0023797F3D|nr:Dam family site-specific DNA-(adenine-N6)-methyltransferase [Alicyclobacillus sp. ALC3]WDL96431.1 Dam family site-specific DNA-(adenine-N6)-methyltransferase [Alicyclobacillus sp. ALC3]